MNKLLKIINNVPHTIPKIKKNTIIESGILRKINIDDNKNSNIPFLINEKYDIKSNNEMNSYYLISGYGMFYPKSYLYYNCVLTIKNKIQDNAREYEIISNTNLENNIPLILYTNNNSNIMLNIDYKYNSDMNFLDQLNYDKPVQNHLNKIKKKEIDLIGNNSKIILLKHYKLNGYGVFATDDIKSGDIIEWGLQRKINNLNGFNCPYVFTWNSCGKKLDNNNIWASGSGNAIFYNSSLDPNTIMYRFYNDYFYIIKAVKDIKKDDELTHYYLSSNWRDCFVNDKELPKKIIN
jgi:hypothetical protein